MSGYHALLSPSSADRWLHCPPSVRAGEHVAKTSSKYAEGGRLAHEIAELKAKKHFSPVSQRTYNSQLKKLKGKEHYDSAMDEYTDMYLETLKEQAMSFQDMPFVALESTVPIGGLTGEVKEDGTPSTGTADCILIGEDTIWVTDYKNGSGVPVDAEDNPQMKLYALGALELYQPIYGSSLQRIRMTIVQPALNNVSSWEVSREDLEAWANNVVAPAAKLALAGEGAYNPDGKGGGGWCRFCPIYATCRARADQAATLEGVFQQKPPAELSPEEMGDFLTQGEFLVSWYNALKDCALSKGLEGDEIPGYKVVEGRSSRDWKEGSDAAFPKLIAAGIDEALLWERKAVTPPALEKALGKKTYEAFVEAEVLKKPGKPALAKAEDSRPAYNPAAAAFRENSLNTYE